jgi:hypothetical protein
MSGFIPRLGYVRPVLQAVGGSRLNRSYSTVSANMENFFASLIRRGTSVNDVCKSLVNHHVPVERLVNPLLAPSAYGVDAQVIRLNISQADVMSMVEKMGKVMDLTHQDHPDNYFQGEKIMELCKFQDLRIGKEESLYLMSLRSMDGFHLHEGPRKIVVFTGTTSLILKTVPLYKEVQSVEQCEGVKKEVVVPPYSAAHIVLSPDLVHCMTTSEPNSSYVQAFALTYHPEDSFQDNGSMEGHTTFLPKKV